MSEIWYNFYLRLVVSGDMALEQLGKALAKGRITQEEYDDLVTHLPS